MTALDRRSSSFPSIVLLSLVGLAALLMPVWIATASLDEQLRSSERQRIETYVGRLASDILKQEHPDLSYLSHEIRSGPQAPVLAVVARQEDGNLASTARTIDAPMLLDIASGAGVHGIELDENLQFQWPRTPMVDIALASAVPLLVAGALATLVFNALLLSRLTRAVKELDARRQDATRLAFEDSLTGVGNRRAFEARAMDGPNRGTSVLFLDLDDFKRVNDELGHAAGDEMIRQTARRIAESIRPQDSVFRVGGDEFVVLIPDATHGMAATIAMRIRTRMTQTFRLGTASRYASISIGIAEASAETDLERLWNLADAAMYDAKARNESRRAA